MDKNVEWILKRYKAACKRAGVKELQIQHKMICCRKPECSVCEGRAYAHGPYNVGYYKDKKGKRHWVYIGKVVKRSVDKKVTT